MASLNNIYINEFYRSYFNTNKKRPQGKLDKLGTSPFGA